MKIISRKEAIEQGLPRYFTGKPCKNGHISERVTKKCDCVECNNLRNADYRSKPENAKIAKERSKRWRDAMGGPEYYKYIRSIQEKNYGSSAAYWKDYNDRNKSYHSERTMKWCADHPEKKRNLGRQRKAVMRNAEGTHTAQDVKSIYDGQGGDCVYCGADLSEGYHVDHIMPLVLGGSNWPNNLQCLCPTCNLRKGGKHPEDWHKEIGLK